MSGSFDITVVGSIAFDDIQTPSGTRKNLLGGSATYFSLAASNFAKVGAVGVVGQDFDEADLVMLRSHGVDTTGIEVASGKTFRWRGHYMDDINSATTLKTELNVLGSFDPQLTSRHKRARCCFLANSHPAIQFSVLNALQSQSTLVVADTMNLWIETARDDLQKLFSKVDLLIINEQESLQYTGGDSVQAASLLLLKHGLKAVVIKRGEYGSYLATATEAFALPAYPVKTVVDPTGAGDSFAGGFIGYLACFSDPKALPFSVLRQAVAYGTAVASFSVSQFGTTGLVELNRNQINARYDYLHQLTKFASRNQQS